MPIDGPFALRDRPRAPAAAGRPINPGCLQAEILEWFAEHRRQLVGREDREPWRVLVLEVMSQQTQIERSLAGSAAFCSCFPTPAALATASPADAVRAWAGLGYNRRALALRSAAQQIVERHGGHVPGDIKALDDLPGIGPYTARAVAARAFGVRVIPVDVNVRRVLGRMLGRPRGATEAREIQALADAIAAAQSAHVDGGAAPGPLHTGQLSGASSPPYPGDIADALMDLAAALCKPRAPDCAACPLLSWCTWAVIASRAATAGLSAVTGEGASTTARSADTTVCEVGSSESNLRSRPAALPFSATRRWLRGQLLRELRTAPPGTWLSIEGARGPHAHASVRETLATLATEGFVELDERGHARLSET